MSYPIRIITRITLELEGPCRIGTGDDTAESDMPFVVDASGLPALPGSSLAGLLRAKLRERDGLEETERWFGASRTSDNPEASRVCVSWAHVHDEKDCPVDGRLHPEDRSDFLQKIAVGEVRDHVRIDHRGTADDGGKFDRQLLYAGTRFSFELEIRAEEKKRDDAEAMRDELLALLHGPSTRLGSGKHSGFGAFRVVRAKGRVFDLRDGNDFTAYTETSPALDEEPDFPPLEIPGRDDVETELAIINVELTPETFFLVGGGDVIEGADDPDGAKIAPVKTRRINWYTGRGTFYDSEMDYLPATSIKGALSHRVAFHANRLMKNFATGEKKLTEYSGENNPVIQSLFGFCRDEAVEDEANSGVGRVVIDDVALKDRGRKKMIHISTDPFTGGVRHGFLFTEEAFNPGGSPIEFTIAVEQPQRLSNLERQALKFTLEDLTSGRLALGSGAGRGNGRFQGDFDWPAQLESTQEVSA